MGDLSSEAGYQPNDAGLGEPVSVLHLIADELLVIAERVRNAAQTDDGESEPDVAPRARLPRTSSSYLALARKAYTLRRKRAVIFGNADLFGEPAWDIMLDLFIAHAEGKPVSVSSACIGSAAPATTGLRWLGVLADEGLVLRENDADDHRRVLVRLTPAGVAAMERFFDAAGGIA